MTKHVSKKHKVRGGVEIADETGVPIPTFKEGDVKFPDDDVIYDDCIRDAASTIYHALAVASAVNTTEDMKNLVNQFKELDVLDEKNFMIDISKLNKLIQNYFDNLGDDADKLQAQVAQVAGKKKSRRHGGATVLQCLLLALFVLVVSVAFFSFQTRRMISTYNMVCDKYIADKNANMVKIALVNLRKMMNTDEVQYCNKLQEKIQTRLTFALDFLNQQNVTFGKVLAGTSSLVSVLVGMLSGGLDAFICAMLERLRVAPTLCNINCSRPNAPAAAAPTAAPDASESSSSQKTGDEVTTGESK